MIEEDPKKIQQVVVKRVKGTNTPCEDVKRWTNTVSTSTTAEVDMMKMYEVLETIRRMKSNME